LFLFTITCSLLFVNMLSASTTLNLPCNKYSVSVHDIDPFGEDYISYSSLTNRVQASAYLFMGGNHFATRGFMEFNLAPWYALGLPVSDITKAEFSINCPELLWKSYTVEMEVYAMTEMEDGVITGSAENQFLCGVDLIQGNITEANFIPNLYIQMTGAELSKITDDIAAAQQWTGITIRKENEYQSAFYESGAEFDASSATLTLTYEASIPEPSVIWLFALGFGIIFKKYFH